MFYKNSINNQLLIKPWYFLRITAKPLPHSLIIFTLIALLSEYARLIA